MTKYTKMFEPLELHGVTLPNRVIMGSMHTGLEEKDHSGERVAAFYAARARGGVGLIVTGGVAPNAEGSTGVGSKDEAAFGQLDNAAAVPVHAKVTEAVHREGGRILLQILHTGRYSYQPQLVAPSAIQAPINPFKPRELTHADIERTIEDFVTCALLSQQAGYDGVEIMGSEGYLINQFIAARTNQRTDEWGGSFANRIRFPIEIVRRMRARAGDKFIIMFRLSMIDLVEGGSTWDEVVALAKELELAGVSIINTGIGWHEARVPTIAQAVPRKAFTWVTRRLKGSVSVPLCTSNRINMPDQIEDVLTNGDADLVSMARPFLADADFVQKAKAGDENMINTCIACNQACLDHIFVGKTCSCLVNPRACHETIYSEEAAVTPQKIAVVGAGPAGMSFASEAAERGHDVTLFEAAEKIGGQLNIARNIPGKFEFDETVRYFGERMKRTGVTVKTNSRVGADELIGAGFDHVVLATGITPRQLEIEGADSEKLVSYVDILTGRVVAGEKVAIIGAGGIGFDTAEFLLADPDADHADLAHYQQKWGIDGTWGANAEGHSGLAAPAREKPYRQLTMLQRKTSKMGAGLGKTTGWIHRAEMALGGVAMVAGASYDKIDEQGLHITVGDESRVIEADTIVVCAGQLPLRNLQDELTAAGVSTHLIGGADVAAELDAKRAIDQGLRLAIDLSAA